MFEEERGKRGWVAWGKAVWARLRCFIVYNIVVKCGDGERLID